MGNKTQATKHKPAASCSGTRKGKKLTNDENATLSPCCPKPRPLNKQGSTTKAGDAHNDAALALMSLGAAMRPESQDSRAGSRMDYR